MIPSLVPMPSLFNWYLAVVHIVFTVVTCGENLDLAIALVVTY